VSQSYLTFTLALKQKSKSIICTSQKEHWFSHNGIAFTIDSIRLVELMNLFSYPLQKDLKEKLLLDFNIIGNDVDRRCTRSHLARRWMQTKLFCLFIWKCLQVLRITTLHLSNGLHFLFIFSLPEFQFFSSGVQLLGKCGSKGYMLLELEVPFILYRLDMDVNRPASLLREMSILCSIQELTMARTDDHVCLTCSITNPSMERMSWCNGCMDLFHLIISSEGLGTKDVDLDVPDGLGAFIGYLSAKIFRLLLVA
jgi:hypothetical protein